MSDWVMDLKERSKNDREIIVGSEVRQLCSEIATLRARVAVLEAALRDAETILDEYEGDPSLAVMLARAALAPAVPGGETP